LQVLIANRGSSGHLCVVNHDVPDLPLLRNGVVVLRLVAFVKSLELLVGWMQLLEDVGLRDDGVFKLHFRVALIKFVAHIGVTYKGAARNQSTQFADEDKFLFLRFKLGNRHIILLEQIFVLFLSDKLAPGKEPGCQRPVLKFVAKFIVADAQTHAPRLGYQCLLVDQLLGSLGGEIRQQHARLRSALRKLLPDHSPGLTLNLKRSHGLVANRSHSAGRRRADTKTGADTARNQRNRHRSTDQNQKCAKYDLYRRAGILKLSNHSQKTPSAKTWLAPSLEVLPRRKGEFTIINQRSGAEDEAREGHQ